MKFRTFPPVIKRIVAGAVIGIANIIPGVSGGTMAVVLGLYDDIIASISHFLKEWKRSLALLAPLGVGAVLGVVCFSALVKAALERYALATNFLFIGLIVGSLPLLVRYAFGAPTAPENTGAHAREQDDESVASSPLLNSVVGVVACAAMLGLAFLPDAAGETLYTQLTLATGLRLFAAGVVACAAMIVPGISGSFMFVLFGVYLSIVTAISEGNIAILAPVALGALVGLVGGAKVIDWLFRRFKQPTYCAIFGLVAGSVVELYLNSAPFVGANLATFAAACALLVGIAIAFLFGKTAS